jgi:transcription elongation factor GreA
MFASSDDFGELSMDDAQSSSGSGGSSFVDDEETLVTKEGLKKLKEELENLKMVRRREVSQRLKEAISYGDLSENSEYEEAKNEQAFVEGRIIELERKIKNAKIISEHDAKKVGKEVNVGSHVTVRDVSENEAVSYTIVGATEADPFEFKISNESPLGKAVLGQVKGDVVQVATPSGTISYEIVKVA